MSSNSAERSVRERLRTAVDRLVPDVAAEDRVMRTVSTRRTSGGGSALAGARLRGMTAALVAGLVIVVLGGALGVGVALRNRSAPLPNGPPPHEAVSPPIVGSSPSFVPTSPPQTSTPTPAGLVSCTGSMLDAGWVDTTGAAGSQGGDIALHNHSSSPCTMRGYTNIQGVINGSLVQLGVTHSLPSTLLNNNNGTLPPVLTVTLPPGATAYVAVEYSDVPTSSTPCPSVTSLLITPPDDTAAITVMGGTILFCGGYGASIWIDEAPVSLTRYFAQ